MPNFAMPGKIAWAAVTYILQGMASTVLLIPLNTLMGRLTSNQQQRVHMNQFGSGFSLLGSMFVTGYTMKMVMALSPDDLQKGMFMVACIFSIIYIACHLIVFFVTRGYEPLEQFSDTSSTNITVNEDDTLQKTSFKAHVLALVSNKMWLCVVVMWFVTNVAMSLENAALPFYLQYNHGENMEQLYSLYSKIGMVIPIVCILGINHLTRWIGVARTAFLGSLLTVIAYAFRFVAHDASIITIGIGWGIYQLGNGLLSTVIMLLIF